MGVIVWDERDMREPIKPLLGHHTFEDSGDHPGTVVEARATPPRRSCAPGWPATVYVQVSRALGFTGAVSLTPNHPGTLSEKAVR